MIPVDDSSWNERVFIAEMFGEGKEVKKDRIGYLRGTRLMKTSVIVMAAAFTYVITFTGLLLYNTDTETLKKKGHFFKEKDVDSWKEHQQQVLESFKMQTGEKTPSKTATEPEIKT